MRGGPALVTLLLAACQRTPQPLSLDEAPIELFFTAEGQRWSLRLPETAGARPVRLTTGQGTDFNHVLASTAAGDAWMAGVARARIVDPVFYDKEGEKQNV